MIANVSNPPQAPAAHAKRISDHRGRALSAAYPADKTRRRVIRV